MATEIPPATAADAAYRRGTVLGLTVAEIFILLLFLLLLAFLTWEDDRQRAVTELAEARQTLQAIDQIDRWKEVVAEFETPEEVLTLRRQRERAERDAEMHQEQAEALRELLEGESAADAIDKAQEAQRQAVAAKEEAEQRAAEATEALRVLRVKGENPPCWYEIVAADDGGTREKPHYALNLAVFDQGIAMRPSPVPLGGAADDNGGTYAAEAARLGLGALPYNKMLGDSDVRRLLQPIHDAGKERQVRTYSCIFFVRVWDQTSADAKARWKHAHLKVIEQLFGTYVRNDPWPPQ
ncbi:MAG: hypothetical protein OXI55_04020 [Gammaproteobacteria bacterium]|nr:hypothetical protein [Gammaproteobacteria bacterium]